MTASRAQIWLAAARPRTLPAAAAPVVIGCALAVGHGALALIPSLAALVAALLIQIGTNFANDYYDFIKGTDTHTRIGPTRATQAGLVTPTEMKRATYIVFTLALLVGCYLVWRTGWPIALIGVLSIAFGLLYTAGPFPLGYNGLGDIFVLVFFGPVAVAGTYYVNTLAWGGEAIVAGLMPGLFSVGILTINNLRDIEDDRVAGKRTLAVRFGRKFARIEYLLCVIAPHGLALGLALFEQRRLALVSLAVLIPTLPALRQVWSSDDGPMLNSMLAATGRLLILHAVIFSIGWVLM
ncbi:MAG: 1,4-dihydroxy-2-naphthoate polyprenyltransferase [candidate division Zixibacteria bacterium]|nr:1,4-dihydroxy-2-naphthoate polyprenyltransferase [candidate division Zixibacteria bacterium]